MNKHLKKLQKFSFSCLKGILSIGLLLALLVNMTAASTVTDGSTPLGLSPGAPAGSYPLGGFDNINLYNGNLNFRLPMLNVGGRGGALNTIGRMIEQHWRMDHWILPDQTEIHTPMYNPWTPLILGYSPGVLYGRQVNDGNCYSQGGPNESTLTRLTFVMPDGTEIELRDRNTGGAVMSSYCYGGLGFSRGTVFGTADGTSATFVSDTTINDAVGGSGSSHLYPTGYLLLRDGTRYRIVNGRVSWIRDRNGNQLSFTYPSAEGMIVTDSLGRQITVTPNVSDVQPYGLSDHIVFNGVSGTPRTIRVSKTNLGNALRSGYSLQTPFALWGTGSSSTFHDPQVLSAVWLPDGRSYKLRYNSYGELARVELPTGGAFEYDYDAGLVNGSGSGGVFSTTIFNKPEIYRRVVEKRIYKEGGVLEGKMTVSRTDNQYTNDTTVVVDHRDAAGTLLSRNKHYFHGNPTKSFDIGSLEYAQWKHGREYQTESYDSNGTTVLRRVENTWKQPVAGANWPLTQPETNDFVKTNKPQITETRTVLVDSNQVAKTRFAYDLYCNQTDVYEYDFGAGAPPTYATRRTQITFLTTNPVNWLDYASPNPNASSVHLRSLPQHQRVYSVNPSTGQETQVAHTETLYDETAWFPWYGTVQSWVDPGTARGNPTKQRSWVNPGNTWIETRSQFDQVGNLTKFWDARNNTNEMAYSATCHFAYPSQTTSAIPDPSGQFGSSTAFVTTTAYDFSTGLVTSTTDANGQTTNIAYNDALDRPTKISQAVGTSVQNQTTFSYDDVNRIITTTSDQNAYNDNLLKSQTVHDGLGRTTEMRQYEGGTNYIVTKQQYDALSRVFKTSKPFRPWQGESAVWTTTAFDALGRVLTVTTPDNSVVTTSYSGSSITVTDQVGKKRKSVTGALGRLKEVYEDPLGVNYLTSYAYDALDNLTAVTQGTQTRTFIYDSLKRLTSATNPESGTLSYQYDNNGNLLVKTDARGTVTTYVYDALNRNTTINYSDTTGINPDLTRVYDTTTHGKGRLRETYSGGTETTGANVEHTKIVSYDALGRPMDQRQRFKTNSVWSAEFQTQRGYNLASNVTSQTYPSGRGVAYAYDTAGRLNSFTGSLGDGVNRNYSTEIIYSPLGGTAKEKFGTDTPLYNKSFYNSRGQLSEIRVGTTYTGPTDGGWQRGAIINHYSSQCWGACNGTDNNGNLKQQDHWIPDSGGGVQGLFVQNYTYDNLNRLLRVQEGSWQQEYVYDRWGNRTIHQTNTWGTGINKKAFTVNTANNRLGVPGGQSGVMTYDDAGNLTNDTYTGAGGRVYDAENRMTKAWGGNNQWQEYSYNADGQRTRRKIDGVETCQIYGMDGELLAEYAAGAAPTSPQKEYGYRNGQLLVTATVPLTSGTGLQGQYFDNMNFTDLKVTRTDATVNFDWGGGTPDPAIGVDTFTVRWQGKVEPQYSQTYTFYTLTDDGVRLWVNGQLIIDKWIDQGPTEWSGSIALTAGQRYDVVMEFYENGGGATAKLSWSSASQPKQIIPQSRLYPPGSSSQVAFAWLVADQLGTPRMIFDKTGSLAATKRHDYLPFGEELFASVGGRTIALGYTGDTIRQKFTSYERDVETVLDYANARYFANVQGRFTSSDPMLSSGNPAEPQSWNRYAYVLNNPLVYADPSGLIWGYQDGTNLNGERVRTFVWFEGDQVGEGFEPYYSSHYVGRNEVLWLDSGSDQFLRIDRSNFSEAEYTSLLSAQGLDCTAFNDQQRNIVNREIADEIGRSWQYGVMKGIASLAGGLAGGIGNTINFTLGASARQANRLPPVLFHYTDESGAAAIQSSQLGRPDRFLFLTDQGGLTPLQAQLELSLPQTNTARTLFAVDTQALTRANLLRSGRVTGNVFNRPGGGFEFMFDKGTSVPQGSFTRFRF